MLACSSWPTSWLQMKQCKLHAGCLNLDCKPRNAACWKSQVQLARKSVYSSRADLHKQLTLLQSLHATLPHNGSNIVLTVCQAVQSKGCIVLQVAVARSHQLQQRPQAPRLRIMIRARGISLANCMTMAS